MKRWYPRLYPWIRRYPSHARKQRRELSEHEKDELKEAGDLVAAGGMPNMFDETLGPRLGKGWQGEGSDGRSMEPRRSQGAKRCAAAADPTGQDSRVGCLEGWSNERSQVAGNVDPPFGAERLTTSSLEWLSSMYTA